MKIYKLPQKLREIEEAIELAHGEITEEIEQRLEEYRRDEGQYFPQIASLIDEYATASQRLKEKADECNELSKQRDATAKRLQLFTLKVMEEMGQDKLQFDTVTIRRQKNPPSVFINDENKIPNEYKVAKVKMDKTMFDTMVDSYGMEFTKVEYDFRKKEILEELKAGNEIDGAEIKQTMRLVIKGA